MPAKVTARLLTTCSAMPASMPPVRQASQHAATAKEPMSIQIHTSIEPWATTKVAADTAVDTASATTGLRIQAPTACTTSPRKATSLTSGLQRVVRRVTDEQADPGLGARQHFLAEDEPVRREVSHPQGRDDGHALEQPAQRSRPVTEEPAHGRP